MRPRLGRTVGGVCAGIAQYYGWDPILLRVLTVVLFFVGCGSILIAYIAAWIIIPNEPYYYVPPMYTPPASGGTGASYAGTAGGTPIS